MSSRASRHSNNFSKLCTRLTIVIAAAAVALGIAPTCVAQPAPEGSAQQVRVQIRILEWKLSNTLDFDFAVLFTGGPGTTLSTADLTVPASTPLSSAARIFLSGLDAGSGSFEAVIETLETVGEIKVLTQSDVIIPIQAKAAGQEMAAFDGRVSSESRIPFETVKAFGGVRLASTTEYKDTGVDFQCNALGIRYGEFIELGIAASVRDLNDFISVGVTFNEETEKNEPLLVPITDNREIRSQILVRDESILIAGLLKSAQETERRQGIPWISELPILRWFFSNYAGETEVTELVFLVKTEIIDPPGGAS